MAQGIGYKDSDGSYGFRLTEDGKVILGNTSDDVIQITGTLSVSGTLYAGTESPEQYHQVIGRFLVDAAGTNNSELIIDGPNPNFIMLQRAGTLTGKMATDGYRFTMYGGSSMVSQAYADSGVGKIDFCNSNTQVTSGTKHKVNITASSDALRIDTDSGTNVFRVSGADTTIAGDMYVDVIRRQSDSSTTTKIRLMDEEVKIHAGNANDEVLKVESGTATINGDLVLNQYIKHNGDENTWINFTDNRIRLNAGGNNFIDCEDPGSAPHKVRINNGGNNIDFVIKDNSGNVYFTADASTSRVGINQTTPSATLDVGGTIAATTLDISGDADIDGTLETDALSINGTTITATGTELNYVDGVTSAIQTQLDAKAPSTGIAAAALADDCVIPAKVNTSVVGNGLTGGGGSALAVGAGTGVTVNSNDVAIGQAVGTGDTVEFSKATLNTSAIGSGEVMRIKGTGDNFNTFVVFGTDTTTEYVSLGITGGVPTIAGGYSGTTNASHLAFATQAGGGTSEAEKVRITSDGKVGIGTTTPHANLSIEGDADGGVVSIRLGADDSSASNFSARLEMAEDTDANQVMTYGAFLDYDGDASSGDGNGQLNIGMRDNSTSDTNVLRIDRDSAANSLHIKDSNVAVGTQLHVTKNATVGDIGGVTLTNAGVKITDSGTSMYIDGNSINTTANSYINVEANYDLYFGTNNTERMRIKNDGHVLINTNSADTAEGLLQVKQSADDNDGGGISIIQSATDDAWTLWQGSDENLYFTFNNSTKGYLHDTVNVGAIDFTGQHRSTPSSESSYVELSSSIGKIVVSDGTYSNLSGGNIVVNEAIPKVKLSNSRNQKSAFGVVSDAEEQTSPRVYSNGAFASVFDKGDENDHRIIINSLGEGGIWISNINGNIENGDYITTCEIPGYGMKQDDDLLHNYTVAKITQDCLFDLNSTTYECEEIQHNGQTYRVAFVGCTYHCG